MSAQKPALESGDSQLACSHPALPFHGEFAPAANRRFRETIVFVHHFGGSKRSVLRHVRMVNDFGFDAVRFNLSFMNALPLNPLPITADLRLGTRHLWTDQIETIFNLVPGPKIAYTFSMPSIGALDAMARRHAEDFSGWICDGGPFLNLPLCTWNLFKHEYRIRNVAVRGAMTALALPLFGLGLSGEIREMLASLPPNFPVLSVRGWKDPLVPPQAIDEIFLHQTHLDFETLPLPDGHHLDGLKLFPELYRDRLEGFLNRIASRLASGLRPDSAPRSPRANRGSRR